MPLWEGQRACTSRPGEAQTSASIPQSLGRKKIGCEREGGRVIEEAKESGREKEGEEKERPGSWLRCDSVVPKLQGLGPDMDRGRSFRPLSGDTNHQSPQAKLVGEVQFQG